jgi:hypothetical protein
MLNSQGEVSDANLIPIQEGDMELRSLWQAAKSVSQDKFKKENPITKDPTKTPPTAYPLKFKEDLGPTLDDYEKAKKPEDKAKYAKKAKDVIKSYRGAIDKEKLLKGKESGNTLVNTLNHIEGKIK